MKSTKGRIYDYNDVSRPGDANGFWYSATAGNDRLPRSRRVEGYARRSRTARNTGLPQLQDEGELVKNGTALKCGECKRVYPIKDDIPVMLLDEATVEP